MLHEYKGIRPTLGKDVFIAEGAHIIGDVILGDNVSIWFNAVLRGDIHYIRVGNYSNIQDGAILHVEYGDAPIEIGNHVTVGHGAILHGCVIFDNSLIGMGAIVLNNAEIGEGCIVAAGSVVREGEIVPPRSLIAGVPATIKRNVSDEEFEKIQQSAHYYIEYKENYIRQKRSKIAE